MSDPNPCERGECLRAPCDGTPRPTVGRIVHYYPTNAERDEEVPKGEPLAAIVVQVKPMTVLRVFAAFQGQEWDCTPEYADQPTPGHWSWPPRV